MIYLGEFFNANGELLEVYWDKPTKGILLRGEKTKDEFEYLKDLVLTKEERAMVMSFKRLAKLQHKNGALRMNALRMAQCASALGQRGGNITS